MQKHHFNVLMASVVLLGSLMLFLTYTNLNLSEISGAVTFEINTDDSTIQVYWGNNSGIFEKQKGNYSDTSIDDNSYFIIRRRKDQVVAANQSISFDVKSFYTNSSIKITGIKGSVKYCHAKTEDNVCDGGSSSTPQGTSGHMDILIQNQNGSFIDVGDITPTTTSTERINYWNLSNGLNFSSFVNKSGYININLEFVWNGDDKSAFLNDYSTLTLSYDAKPNVNFVSPVNNSDFFNGQNESLNCNAADDSNSINVTLFIDNKLNQSKISSNGLVNFNTNLEKGKHNWNCLVDDSVNDKIFAINNFTLNVLGNLSANSLGCNSSLSINSENDFITGHATTDIESNNYLYILFIKIISFFKEFFSFTGLVIFEQNDYINCNLNLIDYEGYVTINANVTLPDNSVQQISLSNNGNNYKLSLTNTSLAGNYNIMWGLADDKNTIFIPESFSINQNNVGSNTNSSNITSNSTETNQTTNPSPSPVSSSSSGGGGGGGRSRTSASIKNSLNTNEVKSTSNTENIPSQNKENKQEDNTRQTEESNNNDNSEIITSQPVSQTQNKSQGFFNGLLGNAIKTYNNFKFVGGPENIIATISHSMFNSRLIEILLIGLLAIISGLYISRNNSNNENIKLKFRHDNLIENYHKKK